MHKKMPVMETRVQLPLISPRVIATSVGRSTPTAATSRTIPKSSVNSSRLPDMTSSRATDSSAIPVIQPTDDDKDSPLLRDVMFDEEIRRTQRESTQDNRLPEESRNLIRTRVASVSPHLTDEEMLQLRGTLALADAGYAGRGMIRLPSQQLADEEALLALVDELAKVVNDRQPRSPPQTISAAASIHASVSALRAPDGSTVPSWETVQRSSRSASASGSSRIHRPLSVDTESENITPSSNGNNDATSEDDLKRLPILRRAYPADCMTKLKCNTAFDDTFRTNRILHPVVLDTDTGQIRLPSMRGQTTGRIGSA